jgi:S1-C subfamily serine protease
MRRALMMLSVLLLLGGCGESQQLTSITAPDSTSTESTELHKDSVERSVKRMTLRIRNLSCQGVATGSGFAIDNHTLVTNHHVVDGAVVLEVNTWDGQTLQAKVKSVSAYGDIALIEVADELPVTAKQSTDAVVGEQVTAVGYPLGQELTLSDGVIKKYEIGQDGLKRARVDAAVFPGNSGGPLVNNKGEVVGVITEKDTRNDNGLALPISDLTILRNMKQTSVEACRYEYH